MPFEQSPDISPLRPNTVPELPVTQSIVPPEVTPTMSIPKQMIRMTDFSGGQISASSKRADDKPLVRASTRTMENYRILNTGIAEVRPGRNALFLQEGRTDEVRIATADVYRFCFGGGCLKIRDGNGAVVATDPARPWDAATVEKVVWTVFDKDVFITFPGARTRVASLSNGAWTFADYAFGTGTGSALKAPFYRFPNTAGITLKPSGINPGSAITVEFSGDVLTAAHVGCLFRYHGAQLRITAVTDARHANAICVDYLPQSVRYVVASSDGFKIGELVEGATTNTRGEIRNIPDGAHVDLIILNNRSTGFGIETMVGPNTKSEISSGSPLDPLPTTVWDEQAISDARGWPQSCSTDSSRLIFCDLPGAPEGIIWSAIASAYDLEVTADAAGAMFETIAGRPRVYHVLGGADEFVFTDRGVKYIPISQNNPLKPGSVSFVEITSDAASSVRPVSMAEGVLFVDARRGRVIAISGTGQVTRPYIAQDVSEFHADLFKMPKVLAATTGGGAFAERYIFALNEDGTLAIGKFNPSKEWVGWLPWVTPGKVEWVSALDSAVLFTTLYQPNSVDRHVVELMEKDIFLEGQVAINNVQTALAPAPGLGPLWWRASSQVALMNGRRFEGYRDVDANGFITPEEGEDLSAPNLMAGLFSAATLIPFVRHAPEGQSTHQSQRKRKIGRISVAVQNSTGFTLDGKSIPPWLQGENQEGQPPLREETYRFRKLGRAVDPTITILKDVPGPLRILEIGIEVTV